MKKLRKITEYGQVDSKVAFSVCLLLTVFFFASCSPGGGPESEKDSSALQTTDLAQDGADLAQDQSSSAELTPSNGIFTSISGVDPCELLTMAEVEAVVGEPLLSSEESVIANYKGCEYHSQDPGKFIILQVTQQSAERFKTDNEETAAFFETELRTVENLGDEAAFYSGLLRVRVGEVVVQIATWHPESELDQAFEMTQALARLAIERLP